MNSILQHEHNKRELEDGEKTTMGAKRTKMNTSDSSSKDTDEGSDTFYSFTSGSEWYTSKNFKLITISIIFSFYFSMC